MSRKRTDHRRCFCKKLMSNCACRSTNLVEFPSKSEYLDFSYFSLCFLLHRSFSPTRHVFSDFLFQEEEKKASTRQCEPTVNRQRDEVDVCARWAKSSSPSSFVVVAAFFLLILQSTFSCYVTAEVFTKNFPMLFEWHTVALEFKSRRMKISY